MSAPPRVLLVDDRADTARGLLSSIEDQAEVRVLGPEDVVVDDLYDADLVLVDHFLDDWLAAYEEGPSVRPLHGVALAGSLRSYVDGLGIPADEVDLATATAFALVSAELPRVGALLPDDMREHAIARLHNLEWAFDKNAAASLGPQVLSLARAVQRVQESGKKEPRDGRSYLAELLGLSSESPWLVEAQAEMFECHPPVFELSQSTKGLAPIRWLLHRILPYPTFLIDATHAANRLGISTSSIELIADSQVLADAEYRGVLSDFIGRRWWRAGLEQSIWQLTDGRRKPLVEAINDAVNASVEPLDESNPVVVLDGDYHSAGVVSGAQAVRVQPDDWPPYADAAWMAVSLIEDEPDLRRLVVDADLDRLPDCISS